MSNEKQKMTVFKNDRHEDVASIIFAGLVVLFVLGYMAFIVPTVKVKASQDGKLISVAVEKGAQVKKGDTIYTLEVVEKKWKDNVMEEKVVTRDVSIKANGKVIEVPGKPGSAVKKGKDTIIVLDHEKGTLP